MPDSDNIPSILVHMYIFGNSFCIVCLFSVSILDLFCGLGNFLYHWRIAGGNIQGQHIDRHQSYAEVFVKEEISDASKLLIT